jgi:hypothetical protein
MTIVAYREGVLATDSQATNHDGLISGSVRKIWVRMDGALCSAAGGTGDMGSFAAWFLADSKEQGRWRGRSKEHGFSGIIVEPDGQVTLYDIDGQPYRMDAPFYARGVGSELAIGAMAMGATAEQAVEIACRYSTYCGGPVQVERLPPACPDTRRGGK